MERHTIIIVITSIIIVEIAMANRIIGLMLITITRIMMAVSTTTEGIRTVPIAAVVLDIITTAMDTHNQMTMATIVITTLRLIAAGVKARLTSTKAMISDITDIMDIITLTQIIISEVKRYLQVSLN